MARRKPTVGIPHHFQKLGLSLPKSNIHENTHLDCDVDGGFDNKRCLGVLGDVVHSLWFLYLTAVTEEVLEFLMALDYEGVQALQV